MKRWAILVVSCLLLGLAATVLVAWTRAAAMDTREFVVGDTRLTLDDMPVLWHVDVTRRRGFAQVRTATIGAGLGAPFAGFGPQPLQPAPAFRGELPDAVPAWSRVIREGGAVDGTVYIDSAWGWPLLALRYEAKASQLAPSQTTEITGAIPLGARGSGLPLRPIAAGLVVNTLLYALVALTGWMLVGALRGRGRRGAGVCPSCGYDLRDEPAAGCSECGWERA